MSAPYGLVDMFGRGSFFACDDPNCEREHVELPDGSLHHEDCECDDCSLYGYLFLK